MIIEHEKIEKIKVEGFIRSANQSLRDWLAERMVNLMIGGTFQAFKKEVHKSKTYYAIFRSPTHFPRIFDDK